MTKSWMTKNCRDSTSEWVLRMLKAGTARTPDSELPMEGQQLRRRLTPRLSQICIKPVLLR